MTEEEIHTICERYGIENYKINSDMTVDVDGDVNLSNEKLIKFPLKFGKITGVFDCHNNKLTSLDGCPYHVSSAFDCSYNNLTTLQHLPMNFYIGRHFYCYRNNLNTSMDFSKLLFGYIGNDVYTHIGTIDKFINKNKNPPKKDLPRLLSELRKITL